MKTNSESYSSQFAGDTCFPGVCRKISRSVCYRRNTGFRTCSKYLHNLNQNPDTLLMNSSLDYLHRSEAPGNAGYSNSNTLIVNINMKENIMPAIHSDQFGALDYLVKNQMMEQKIETLMDSGRTQKKMTSRIYQISVLNTALTAIGIPVLLWLILETFFK
jgi:hypothetical protein